MDNETLWILKKLSAKEISAQSAERILRALKLLEESEKGAVTVGSVTVTPEETQEIQVVAEETLEAGSEVEEEFEASAHVELEEESDSAITQEDITSV